MAIGRIASEGDLLRFIELRLEPFGTLLRQIQTSIRSGDGSPEGNVAAPPGVLYEDRVGGDVYRKGSGTGTTGWLVL